MANKKYVRAVNVITDLVNGGEIDRAADKWEKFVNDELKKSNNAVIASNDKLLKSNTNLGGKLDKLDTTLNRLIAVLQQKGLS